MADGSSICSHSSKKIVPLGSGENVPLQQLGHSFSPRKYIKRASLEELAIERGRKGITWKDMRDKFHAVKVKLSAS
jgi:hypothetical protein